MQYKSPTIHQTPLYRAKAAYANMKRRCDGGKAQGSNRSYIGCELRMALEEWLAWSVPLYEEFLDKFPDERPVAARLGDEGHYEIGNVKIISATQNRREMKNVLLLRPDGYKMCGCCREAKVAAEFNKHAGRPDGLNHVCRRCHSEYGRLFRLRRKLRKLYEPVTLEASGAAF